LLKALLTEMSAEKWRRYHVLRRSAEMLKMLKRLNQFRASCCCAAAHSTHFGEDGLRDHPRVPRSSGRRHETLTSKGAPSPRRRRSVCRHARSGRHSSLRAATKGTAPIAQEDCQREKEEKAVSDCSHPR
jgi:hypothetical protein